VVSTAMVVAALQATRGAYALIAERCEGAARVRSLDDFPARRACLKVPGEPDARSEELKAIRQMVLDRV